MRVRIKRQDNEKSKPYWQSFEYNDSMTASIAYVIDTLNFLDDLKDIDGNPARRIKWECSCMQKMCGACAMVICGKPALACNTFLHELKSDELILEPLSKFPVLCDLCVDRSGVQQRLIDTEAYIHSTGDISLKENKHRYSSGKCLKCCLCLEVCPNYKDAKMFYGANFANDTYLIHSANADRDHDIKGEYKKHFYSGCSRCLSCQNICPMDIPLASSMAKMNRK